MFPKNCLSNGRKRPGENFEQYLLAENIITAEKIETIKAETKSYIETELSIAYNARPLIPDTDEEMNDVYAPAPGYGPDSGKEPHGDPKRFHRWYQEGFISR